MESFRTWYDGNGLSCFVELKLESAVQASVLRFLGLFTPHLPLNEENSCEKFHMLDSLLSEYLIVVLQQDAEERL